ncbi:MAG: MBL fold metallo-hydrolase, partial [bacterium]|nr:MBL fold metallo-hydrolase [bacterium]
MRIISKQSEKETLKDSLQHTPAEGAVALWWLGQAGFAIKSQEKLLVIDPYLSDFLAKKYHGKFFPHTRMMPPPILPEELQGVDMLLCTHRHSDHLDPETAPILARNTPDCTLVVPKSAGDWSLELEIAP